MRSPFASGIDRIPQFKFKGSQTTTIVPPPKSATQLAIEEKQLEVLDLQLQELQQQNEALGA